MDKQTKKAFRHLFIAILILTGLTAGLSLWVGFWFRIGWTLA